jgi:hypothetical protein
MAQLQSASSRTRRCTCGSATVVCDHHSTDVRRLSANSHIAESQRKRSLRRRRRDCMHQARVVPRPATWLVAREISRGTADAGPRILRRRSAPDHRFGRLDDRHVCSTVLTSEWHFARQVYRTL